jgi:uncharacterized damage-inducible protein DinB
MHIAHTLAARLREVFLNGQWIANTNYQALLNNVTFDQAVCKIENLNTIAQITYHINYYLQGVLQVFEGGPLEIKDKYSFDMPPVQSEMEWKHLVEQFIHHAELYASHVERMTDIQLSQPFVKEEYGTYARNIEGQIEHSYYHLGQITLIHKLVSAKSI